MAHEYDPNEQVVLSGGRGSNAVGVVTTAPGQANDSPSRGRLISRDEFLRRAQQVVTETVYIPLVDGELIIKGLTGVEVSRARADVNTQKGGRTVPREDRDFGAMVLYYAAQTPDGQQFFERQDIDTLNSKVNYAAIMPGVQVAVRLSGLDDEAAELERKKAFERTRDAGN